MMSIPFVNALTSAAILHRKLSDAFYCSNYIKSLCQGIVMLSPLGTHSIVLDVSGEPLVTDGLAKLSALHDESLVAKAKISRRRSLLLLVGANVLVWILIVMTVRLIVF
jgi:hypothetical protein